MLLVPCLYVAGLGLALLVQRRSRANGFFRSLFFMPQMVSLVVVALVWQVLLVDKIGIINRAMAAIGLGGISWLGDPTFALFAIVVVSVWFLMGFYMLIFLGGLQDIPKEYYEAAQDRRRRARQLILVHHPAASPADELFHSSRFDGDSGLRTCRRSI